MDIIITVHIIDTIIITPIVATIITIVAIGDNLRREQQRVPSVTLFEPDLHGRAFLSEPHARPAAILGDELDAGRDRLYCFAVFIKPRSIWINC